MVDLTEASEYIAELKGIPTQEDLIKLLEQNVLVVDKVVSVWDVNAKGWRSFRYERVNKVDIVDEYEKEWYPAKSD
jgi:hypothetical protein